MPDNDEDFRCLSMPAECYVDKYAKKEGESTAFRSWEHELMPDSKTK